MHSLFFCICACILMFVRVLCMFARVFCIFVMRQIFPNSGIWKKYEEIFYFFCQKFANIEKKLYLCIG